MMDKDRTKPMSSFRLPHLDKRSEPRVSTTALAVKITGACQSIYGYARDISRTGMQIRTFPLCDSAFKEVGDQINIMFKLPHKGKDMECRATVMWNDTPPDGPDSITLQGVKFNDVLPSAQDDIDNWLSILRA